jgi:hypothetical protein
MKHKFKHICPDAAALLTGVTRLSTFMSRVEKNSKSDQWRLNNWSPEDYKGLALEALVEVLVTNSVVDKRINIVGYRPHDLKADGPDMGIDGYGTSHNGNLHTVQVKYRSDVERDLTANEDHISNFVSKTTSSPVYRDADMTIFTTAKSLNFKISEDMYHNRVRVIGFKELVKLIDHNQSFWNIFRSEMGC